MLSRGRRGFQGQASSGNAPERVRTHLLFSSQSEHKTAKRKRRTHNAFHQMAHKKDEMVQANPDELQLDPSQWTGNQRVLHFGPMAQRDLFCKIVCFLYYYPKGWDILYPAQFGFFPYRTNKFRGSSTVVCVWAFGTFLALGGALMVYLGYFVLYKTPFWTWPDEELAQRIPPIQIAGPILLVQPRAMYETNPYQPLPPPAYPVLENPYARSTLLNPNAEMKLYPPVMPGQSSISLHGRSPTSFLASPYNTLRAVSANRYPASADAFYGGFENQRTNSMGPPGGSGSPRHSQVSLTANQQRAKSVGAPVKRSMSNRSR
uniref:Uncharacterized protein n=1 Tax=Ditylenchus dipsaci TaxID=166011 RepID=A0A915E883_9BILA